MTKSYLTFNHQNFRCTILWFHEICIFPGVNFLSGFFFRQRRQISYTDEWRRFGVFPFRRSQSLANFVWIYIYYFRFSRKNSNSFRGHRKCVHFFSNNKSEQDLVINTNASFRRLFSRNLSSDINAIKDFKSCMNIIEHGCSL